MRNSVVPTRLQGKNTHGTKCEPERSLKHLFVNREGDLDVTCTVCEAVVPVRTPGPRAEAHPPSQWVRAINGAKLLLISLICFNNIIQKGQGAGLTFPVSEIRPPAMGAASPPGWGGILSCSGLPSPGAPDWGGVPPAGTNPGTSLVMQEACSLKKLPGRSRTWGL